MIEISQLHETMRGLFPEHLGVRLVEASAERLVGELEVAEHHCTTPGILHGGAVMAFADTLGAYATAIQLPPGAGTTTIESKTNFFAAVPSGTKLRGECLPLHRGRRTMVWQTTLRKEDGALAAVVTQTQMVLAAKPRPEEALGALFEGQPADEVRARLARLERAGAALYEQLAESEPDAERRGGLLDAAAREIANAELLESQV